jgi:TrmH family RNA methyltransferase
MKKFRVLHRQFVVEGDKIVKDVMLKSRVVPDILVANSFWLNENKSVTAISANEILEADNNDLERITSLETPPPVLAVFSMPDPDAGCKYADSALSIALDTIQDPGNLGTIIRIADWFGINQIFCSPGCADIYNPKSIQASMGALFNVQVCYTDLKALLEKYHHVSGFPILGTFMRGASVYESGNLRQGIILFGNESRGIAAELEPYITRRITIPAGNDNPAHVESLNVASSVAVVCALVSASASKYSGS